MSNQVLPSLAIYNWPSSTRLWIYNANRDLTAAELAFAKTYLAEFAQKWTSHNLALQAYGDVLFGRVAVLGVDQNFVGAGGCSIDSSVRAMQTLGEKLQLDWFDRMIFLTYSEGSVSAYSREELVEAYASGMINDSTLVVDTLVDSVDQAQTGLIKVLGESWHKRLVSA